LSDPKKADEALSADEARALERLAEAIEQLGKKVGHLALNLIQPLAVDRSLSSALYSRTRDQSTGFSSRPTVFLRALFGMRW
jgi:hypothetical protein